VHKSTSLRVTLSPDKPETATVPAIRKRERDRRRGSRLKNIGFDRENKKERQARLVYASLHAFPSN